MLNLIVSVIVVALVVGLFLWALANLPFIPAPMAQIIRVFIIVVACLWLISILFGSFGGPSFGWNHPIVRINQ
jgi:hypothetical protein